MPTFPSLSCSSLWLKCFASSRTLLFLCIQISVQSCLAWLLNRPPPSSLHHIIQLYCLHSTLHSFYTVFTGPPPSIPLKKKPQNQPSLSSSFEHKLLEIWDLEHPGHCGLLGAHSKYLLSECWEAPLRGISFKCLCLPSRWPKPKF